MRFSSSVEKVTRRPPRPTGHLVQQAKKVNRKDLPPVRRHYAYMNAEQARKKKSLEKKRFPRFREIFRLKCCLEMSEARAFQDARGVGREGEEVEALWRWVSWWPKRAVKKGNACLERVARIGGPGWSELASCRPTASYARCGAPAESRVLGSCKELETWKASNSSRSSNSFASGCTTLKITRSGSTRRPSSRYFLPHPSTRHSARRSWTTPPALTRSW